MSARENPLLPKDGIATLYRVHLFFDFVSEADFFQAIGRAVEVAHAVHADDPVNLPIRVFEADTPAFSADSFRGVVFEFQSTKSFQYLSIEFGNGFTGDECSNQFEFSEVLHSGMLAPMPKYIRKVL